MSYEVCVHVCASRPQKIILQTANLTAVGSEYLLAALAKDTKSKSNEVGSWNTNASCVNVGDQGVHFSTACHHFSLIIIPLSF